MSGEGKKSASHIPAKAIRKTRWMRNQTGHRCRQTFSKLGGQALEEPRTECPGMPHCKIRKNTEKSELCPLPYNRTTLENLSHKFWSFMELKKNKQNWVFLGPHKQDSIYLTAFLSPGPPAPSVSLVAMGSCCMSVNKKVT